MPITKTLDIGQTLPEITPGQFKMGGRNPQGSTIGLNNFYLEQDGKPCIPVMGEFHYSRCPHEEWETELLKMKAGGVDIVATYIFWIHVEEEEGRFDWAGDNNLRKFVELCAAHGLQVLARIGPFAHGECRNGGLPDWLYGRPFAVRSNDERYLFYVKRLYHEIAAQLKGLLFKDGGPVTGVQLDNEFMHCGAPWEVTYRPGTQWVPSGSGGEEHMRILKRMAIEAGLDVPLYTCTGWTNSPVPDGEMLPMQGGYAFTPWSPDPNYRQPPSPEFIFRDRHSEPVLNARPTYDGLRYPYLTCELGGGIQDTYYHRPIVPAAATEGMAVVQLGSGANLLGYYMYHGGSQPVGRHSWMNEFTVPRISYDFQAPLGEFGQFKASFAALRLVHLFLKDFGSLLAPMAVILPDDAASLTPENTLTPRFSARTRHGGGFLFFCNYQDHVEMLDQKDLRIHLRIEHEIISIPHKKGLTLQKNVSAILPFNLSLEGVLLKYATTQPLARIEGTGDDRSINYFFFALPGMEAEYALDRSTYTSLVFKHCTLAEENGIAYLTADPGFDCMATITRADGSQVRIITLTRPQAELCSGQVLWGRQRLIISDAWAVADGEELQLFCSGQKQVELFIYPAPQNKIESSAGTCKGKTEGIYTHYTIKLPKKEIKLNVEHPAEDRAVVRLPKGTFADGLRPFLRIDYTGDTGEAYLDGKLAADNFYNGTPWEIGLNRFAGQLEKNELFILIQPLEKSSSALRYISTGMAFRKEANRDHLAEIKSITAVVEQKVIVRRI
jgi:beta-galactosidase